MNARIVNFAVLYAVTLGVAAPCAWGAPAPTDVVKSPILTEDANPGLKSPITLVARDASLSEVLKVLSERSGMNFVAGEGVHREKITIILSKTPLEEAINLLVRAAGLSYEIIGNSVLIAETGKLKEEVGQSSYVVELKYANAAEVAEMLQDLTKNVRTDNGGNRLICYTSPRVIKEVERIVKSIDHPHVLVMLETRLIEVAMDDLERYGVNWGEMSPLTSGVSYPQTSLHEGFRTSNWLQMPLDINVSLDMLLQDGTAKLLMNSKLTTTNNREASLHIGDVVPYVIQSYNLSAAGGVNQQVQKEKVGTIISMTPHINNDGQITLTLEPEVSTISGWKGENADIPLVRVRKTKTTVRVADGQTIFLAGLLSEETTSETKKLPILGQIPLIGPIFQHQRDDVRKTNLIIEITPRIINDPAELQLHSQYHRENDDTVAEADIEEKAASAQTDATEQDK